eukprot:3595499-Pleurochrysis_carterae.AAC.1
MPVFCLSSLVPVRRHLENLRILDNLGRELPKCLRPETEHPRPTQVSRGPSPLRPSPSFRLHRSLTPSVSIRRQQSQPRGRSGSLTIVMRARCPRRGEYGIKARKAGSGHKKAGSGHAKVGLEHAKVGSGHAKVGSGHAK